MKSGVIAVIGTTGVGKSNLSIQLSKELDGEVINADALQVYKELDIITNKMPLIEREGVEHHLMDFLPLDSEYSVIEFKDDALKLIKEIQERKHVPVIVGGTHYYIQSLLWRDTLLDTKKTFDEQATEDVKKKMEQNEAFLRDADTSTLYMKLQEVDPVMAKKWHENDRRKITRSLQVFFETGERQSDLIKKQHALADNERLRMPSCIFWVYSEPTVLNARLNARVDAMIKGGLFEEIQSMRKMVGPNTDYERGIWQAIGYKEFDPYFASIEKAAASLEPINTQELEALKAECTENMKVRTRQYAKRQVLWIRNKLLPLCREKDVKIFLLDATSLSTWKENVGNVAVQIAKDFFAGKPLPEPTSLNQYAKELLQAQRDGDVITALESWEKKECEICSEMQRIMQDKSGAGKKVQELAPVLVHGKHEWEQHLRSRQHRKLKTFKTEMERDGPNWWFWNAQKHKKRKREEAAAASTTVATTSTEEGAGVSHEQQRRELAQEQQGAQESITVSDSGESGSTKQRRVSLDKEN